MQSIACIVCKKDTYKWERCTNRVCKVCHEKYCTPGGSVSPGHELKAPKQMEAAQ